ncbi:MAG: sugar phosphate nucleotidyltransferase [bacterium]
MKNTFAVIMAGGKGERFWPLSTSKTPKQMLSLAGGKPLIQLAVERLRGLIPPANIFIITSADLAGAIARTVPSVNPSNIIGEPMGRDTAAAVALASALVGQRARNGVFAVLTADHLIGPKAAFQKSLLACFKAAASNDVLITIGIPPTYAATGFGYIEAGQPSGLPGGAHLVKALRFVEKPDGKTAKRYLASGRYYWNSGMFVWSVAAIQKALEKHAPHLYRMARRLEPQIGSAAFRKALAKEYNQLDRISIDYAVMEKSHNILMARSSFNWDDVGTWAAIEKHFPKDPRGNVRTGLCETLDSDGNIVVSDGRLTGLIGVKDLIVVQANGATLICRKDRAEDVKKLVRLLHDTGAYEELL